MTDLKRFSTQLLIKIYLALILGAAAVLSPLTFSFLPVFLLALFLYFEFRVPRPTVVLSLHLYLFLALPLIYELIVGPESSALISLPLLGLLDSDLERLASTHHFQDSKLNRQPSRLLVSLALIIIITLTISAFLGKMNLIVVCALLGGYLLFRLARLFASLPPLPIEVSKTHYRVVAGHNISFTMHLLNRFKMRGWLYLSSPYEWLKLKPHKSELSEEKVDLHVNLTPPLAGPSSISLTGFFLDRLGLIQYKFQIELAELYVIPRARYAAWLARRYLEKTKAGPIASMASTLASFKPSLGSRRGVEYYGNRRYEPGDSLRSIDWKHSIKLNELIVKEYDTPQASSAALLVNLTVRNAEEADQLVYTWIITSITLAHEGIPTMLAVYDHNGVSAATEFLDPRQLVLRSLALSREIVIWARPQKYLQPPNPLRIRSNIRRLKMLSLDSAAKLIELLDLEFKALCNYSASNPATEALSRVLGKGGSRLTILFISAENHDEEALQMAKYRLRARDQRFTEISLDQATPKIHKALNVSAH